MAQGMPHMHITSWVIALILIILITLFYKQKNDKLGKILQMILRLDFLFILFTGIMLLTEYFRMPIGQTGELIVKVFAGLWAIVAMEMIGGKMSKHQSSKGWWVHFIIAAAIAIALGFGRLPLGVLP